MPDATPTVWAIGGVANAGAAAALAERAFDAHFREAWTEAQMAGLLAFPGAWLELGSHTDGLVAFALCRQILDEVELLLCAVSPVARRRGLGLQLVRQAMERARARQARRLFLEVRATNLPALGLYRGAGFLEAGRRSGYYRTVTGDSIDAITLSCSL